MRSAYSVGVAALKGLLGTPNSELRTQVSSGEGAGYGGGIILVGIDGIKEIYEQFRTTNFMALNNSQ
ncbi:MAG TPA: hypothetical protein DEG17_10195 [Cyanobacteria bacterium UBA11149]|nr:hypothetical protein [Cyanobacteria bacterium UBA11367]HBK65104.1 hypothetical protein [Cyanobacteria bacterium UBA11166]HBR72488.1 hypothetical protein [Cyanobacteria bacterium UBA11159]HBS70364.1 hypothetical protein [Cyanobacteria bacterium UBA11153]HBW89219.1 hypothetical protein [Cyanobacteria bacterium UBA11149]HCA97140.1 hypothetical protein [Cyanobacteria bacterium UBA9226]